MSESDHTMNLSDFAELARMSRLPTPEVGQCTIITPGLVVALNDLLTAARALRDHLSHPTALGKAVVAVDGLLGSDGLLSGGPRRETDR